METVFQIGVNFLSESELTIMKRVILATWI